MTRCVSCDRNLNDLEATRKHAVTKEYLELCNYCLRDILVIQPIPYINNINNIGTGPEDDTILDNLFDNTE